MTGPPERDGSAPRGWPRMRRRIGLVALGGALVAGTAGLGEARERQSDGVDPATPGGVAALDDAVPTPAALLSHDPSLPSLSVPTWRDEFDAGSTARVPPDQERWRFETGAHGFGNDELQRYTDDLANAYVGADAHLSIVLRPTDPGASEPYTSARLRTIDDVALGYGYVEARLRMPARPSSGVWPAFWLLPVSGTWPDDGEIDIVETVNGDPGWSTNVHGIGDAGRWEAYDWHAIDINDGAWHTFGALVLPEAISFWLDDQFVRTVSRAHIGDGNDWAYAEDYRFSVLLNVAMGGTYPGAPDGTAALPAVMGVDYVRHGTVLVGG